MSLISPLSSSQIHSSKPMAISTLTSNNDTLPFSYRCDISCLSPLLSGTTSPSYTISSGTKSEASSSPPSDYFSSRSDKPSSHYGTLNTSEMMLLQERRLRNKTASAKYRAKKNRQYDEMRTMLCKMTKENEILLRQLNNLHKENQELKKMLDTLRGKVIAQKMIKQYLCNGLSDADNL